MERNPKPAALTIGWMGLLLLFGAMILGGLALIRPAGTAEPVSTQRRTSVTFVIDAGHGGMDSGAVGVNGCLEKELNLDVSDRLAALMKLAGIGCVRTRADDSMLVDDSVRDHRKMQDLKCRAETAEACTNPVFVSIHMNKFGDPRPRGLQVWYSPNHKASEALASVVQGYAASFLDPDHRRPIKEATSAIWLLQHLDMPAVLIECGFLSNPEECALLCDKDYRTRIAVMLFASLGAWLEIAG